MHCIPSIVVCLLAGSSALAQDIELQRTESRWRFGWETFEAHDLGDAELIGVHYDLLGVLDSYLPFFVGFGGYTQVAGTTEGAFAAGLTPGVGYFLEANWRLEAGAFLGGGGVDGSSDQSGLVTRPFLAIERLFEGFGLRAELGYLNFDKLDGDLVLSLGLSLPSEWLRAQAGARPERISSAAILPRETRITARFLSFDPASDAQRRDAAGLGDFEMLGVGVDYQLDSHWFVPLEAYGASGGNLDGFGLGLLGIGYRLPLVDGRLSLEGRASAGFATGASVDTGGGLALGLGAALRAEIARQISLELSGLLIEAPNGEFSSAALGLGLSWSSFPIELQRAWPRGELKRAGLTKEEADLDDFKVGLATKFYSPKSGALSKDGTPLDDTLSLIGVQIEQPLQAWFSATAKAFVAVDGEVGGYREGLLGLKASHSHILRPEHIFSVGFEAGAAGGGQLDVGAGLLTNLYMGYEYLSGPRSSLSLEFGRSRTNSGSFEASSLSVGWSWSLQRAIAR